MKLYQKIFVGFIFFINFVPSSWLHAAEEKNDQVQEIPTLQNLAGKISAQYITDMINNNTILDEPLPKNIQQLIDPYLHNHNIWNSLWSHVINRHNLKNAEWLVDAHVRIPHDILHRCASKNSLSLMKFFIQFGKDVNEIDELGNLPFDYTYDNPKMIHLLIDHGADVNHINSNHQSVLYRCMSIPTNISSVNELYQKRICPSLKKAKSQHQKNIAQEKKIQQVIVQLILAGAKNIPNNLYNWQPYIAHQYKESQLNQIQAYQQRTEAYLTALEERNKRATISMIQK